MREQSVWKVAIGVQVVALIILLVAVFSPKWVMRVSKTAAPAMTTDVTYIAGTSYGSQEPYWFGVGVGVITSTLVASIDHLNRLIRNNRNGDIFKKNEDMFV